MSLTGHLAHIDFGFMLMNSPGSVGFELAPFKMPQEYIDILGGMNSERFGYFRSLFKMGMLGLRKRSENIIGIIEIMERDSRLPCFTGANKSGGSAINSDKLPVTAALRERFQLHLTDEALCSNLDKLIDSSCNNMFTKLYDSFQVIIIYGSITQMEFFSVAIIIFLFIKILKAFEVLEAPETSMVVAMSSKSMTSPELALSEFKRESSRMAAKSSTRK